ncbi:MAG: site-specific DNA-methyltransferase [Candidatus Parcubacteria bacterium]|nr:MAG: site-specific DNA-methyltransferase [Candidatus Parcubacteria bacterium]
MTKNNNRNQSIDKTELVWPGKRKEVERVELPFQTIETINLPRGVRQEELFGAGSEEGWKNRLIWGDNLLIMGSLLKEFAGKINLIYIDPPFATGDDFSFTVNIGDQAEVTKEPSALEVKAYRDTWGKGMQSYLQMMYDRLVLMKELLADDGSIYVHLDWHVGHYVKILMDEIFGRENFLNEIVWKKTNSPKAQSQSFGTQHDVIFWYSKSKNHIYNQIYRKLDSKALKPYIYDDNDGKGRYRLIEIEAQGVQRHAKRKQFEFRGRVAPWLYSLETLEKWWQEGRIYKSKNGRYSKKQYLSEVEGLLISDLWVDDEVAPIQSSEKVGYETQKPSALLERVIKSASNEGDLVADFFCGSGTTGVVAEKLGRRWIMSDLGRFAIHTTRKRLLDMGAKPFVVQNLGKYERHRWAKLNGKYKDYIKFILELYHAEPVDGFTHLHGKKGKSFVHVGAVDAPVTFSEIREALEECKENNIKRLDMLGWEWEMGLHDLVKEEAEKYGVKLATLQIPREVMEISPTDVKKHDIQFFELAYLEVEPKIEGKKVTITLKDFIIPNPELLPEEVKGKVKNWSDFIDYWAVDWDFNGDSFHNMNQRYRTRKNPKLELSMSYDYKESGKYNVLVKVIDIFGNDTTKLVEVKV